MRKQMYCAIRLDINDLYPHFQYWYSTGNSPGYSQLLSGHPVFCLIHSQAAPSSKPYKVFREERRLLVLTVYCMLAAFEEEQFPDLILYTFSKVNVWKYL